MTNLVGQRISHYQVIEKLGAGGMGVVYKARDMRLGRFVALKVLPPEKLLDPERKRRFVQEARAASALNHPNIITIFDIDSADDVDFIVMELVEGRTLHEMIRRKGLQLDDVLNYASQIASALASAHEAGIVHRDLKPSNIMVNRDGLVKILDFGLAKLTEPSGHDELEKTDTIQPPETDAGVILGTAYYMSPEQAEGQKVDHRSDIFSFGCVLYEMLAGQRPFGGVSRAGVLASILREEPKSLADVAPSCPRELERMVRLCLQKKPARRVRHMDDLHLQLEAMRADGPQPVAPRRRSKWLVPAALAGLVSLSAGVWLGLRPSPKPTMPPELTRLTSNAGLTTEPALSSDGKLLAYASDRAGEGNFDIWVEQMGGVEPMRLTRDTADEHEPSFSADGTQITFRSEKDGGGVYVIPTLGGDARLIAAHGRNPRFSPDGSQIAYWTGLPGSFYAGIHTAEVYVVPSGGGQPRRLQAKFFQASYPIWTPDGQHLLFIGKPSPGPAAGWWVTPVTDGAAVDTGARLSTRLAFTAPKAWIGDRVIVSAVGATGSGDCSSLWEIPIATGSWRVTGPPQRLTFGTGTDLDPSVSATGRVVFASLTLNLNVWGMTGDPNHGKVTGDLQPFTEGFAMKTDPTMSRDGRKLAYIGDARFRGRVIVKDLVTGKETTLCNDPRYQAYPNFSPDGAKVLFAEEGPKHEFAPLYVAPARGGPPQKICEDCGLAPAWSSDQTKVVYDWGIPRQIGVVEVGTGKTTVILKHARYGLLQPQISPDDRWIAFAATFRSDRTHVAIAPFRGSEPLPESEWVQVTDGSGFDVRPRWSPDGNLLYFISDRDGFSCIWGQRLDPRTKRPAGPVNCIRHFHNLRRLLASPPALGFAVAGDKFAFNMTERTGNIWTFMLPDRQ